MRSRVIGKDGLGKSVILKPFKWSERVRVVTNNIKVTENGGFISAVPHLSFVVAKGRPVLYFNFKRG